MLPEALVIFSCIGNFTSIDGQSSCQNSSALYFSENPDFKQSIDKKAESVRQYVGPTVVDIAGPVLFVVAGGSGTVKINKYFSLQVKKDGGMLTFRWNLPW